MAKANLKKKLQFWGTGRRKKAFVRYDRNILPW